MVENSDKYSINEVKRQVIDTSLIVASIVGIIAYLISTSSRILNSNFNISIIFETVILLSLLIVTFKREKLKIRAKASIIILLLTFFSLSDASIYGLWSSARVYLVLVPFFSIIYFPFKRTIVILVLTILCFLSVGYMHHSGILSIPAGYEPDNYIIRLYPWIINAIHISAVGLIVFFITRKFFNSFSDLVIYLEERNHLISEKEKNYREIFNSTGEAIFIHDAETGRIEDINPTMLNMFKFENRDEILNQTVTAISSNIEPYTGEKALEYIKKAGQEGPQFFEWMAKKKTGELFWIEVSLYYSEIGGKKRIMAIVRDYTERRRVEKALAESERKYREMTELLPQTIFETESNGKLIYINKTGLEIFQLNNEDVEKGINIFLHLKPEEREKAVENFSRTMNDLPVDSNQYTMLKKDGSCFHAQVYSRSFEIDKHQFGLRGVVVDITQRINSEKAIRESEFKYRALMESMSEAIIMADNNHVVQYVNKQFTEKLGYLPEEIIGKEAYKILHDPEDLARVEQTNKERINNLNTNYELTFKAKNGRKFDFLVSGAPYRNSEGEIIGSIGALMDITERKKVEKALKESQQQFMTLAEMSPAGIFRTRADGYTIYVNKKWTELSGLSAEKATGHGWLDAVHPDDRNKLDINWQEDSHSGKKSYAEYRFLRPDGTIRWVLGNAVPEIIEEKISGYIGTITDITELKIASEKLENSEKRFREMSDLLPQTIWECNLQGKLTYVNKHGFLLYGYSNEDFQNGLDLHVNIVPNERPRAAENMMKRMQGDNIDFNGLEYTSVRKDGTEFPVKIFVSQIKEQNKVIGLRGINFDITDIRNAEKELRESETRYRTIIEAFPDLIVISDLVGKIIFMNEVAHRITGIDPSDFSNPSKKAFIHPEDIPNVRSAISAFLNSEKIHSEIIENRFIDAWGNMHWFSGTISKIVWDKKPALQTISIDITQKKAIEQELENYRNRLEELVKERTDELAATNEQLVISNEELLTQKESLKKTLDNLNKAQEQLIQSEKMASLGVLAAGVAHEINNPLNFINGGVLGIESYLSENFPDQVSELSFLFSSVYEGVQRATSIIESLNHYSHKNELSLNKCEIHSIIDNCLVILQNQMKHRIEVIKEYTTQKYALQGNEGRLHQAFLNILVNASQAITEKGIITIQTFIKEGYLSVEIKDTGVGISKENIKKIMDPFFTTKDPGKGTGLGLSITYSIIKEHRGILEFASEPGKGSTFTVRIPVKLIN